MAKLCVIVFLLSVGCVQGYPEAGKFHQNVAVEGDSVTPIVISKTMFNGTDVLLDITTFCHDRADKFTVEWIMFDVHCYGTGIQKSVCFDSETKTLKSDCACNLVTVEQLHWMNGTGEVDCDQTEYTSNKDNSGELYSKSDCPRESTSSESDVTDDENKGKAEDDKNGGGKGGKKDESKASESSKGDSRRKKRALLRLRREGDTEDESTENSKAGEEQTQSGEDNGEKTKTGEKGKGKKTEASGKDKGKKTETSGKDEGKKTETSGKGEREKPMPGGTAEKTKDTEGTIATSKTDGPYSVVILIKKKGTQAPPKTKRDAGKAAPAKNVSVDITVKDSKGHLLSAADLPYLYFYLCMTILYVFYGFIWLLNMACYWRDLLRIQYFIGLVIILGFIEKVFYYSEYENVDKTGQTTKTMVIVAELVAVAKKTLARALVIVVSVGFGLVKPRLGPTLHKLIAVCVVYFILSSVESCLRVMENVPSRNAKNDEVSSQPDLLAAIPLALCETGIIWWVFTSLYQTIRTLRLRRNVAKLSLYRHFTNLLIFAVLASVGFMVWYLLTLRFSDCLQDIRELWMEKGFWPLLFSVMLMVIMILWRPSMNSQRYSHSLLLDNDEDEDATEDTVMGTKAFAAMKRPQSNGRTSSRDKRKTREEKVEDDLQWIEDNIPASVADSTLQPAMIDSEEELMTTRFELSKMD